MKIPYYLCLKLSLTYISDTYGHKWFKHSLKNRKYIIKIPK